MFKCRHLLTKYDISFSSIQYKLWFGIEQNETYRSDDHLNKHRFVFKSSFYYIIFSKTTTSTKDQFDASVGGQLSFIVFLKHLLTTSK